MIKAGIDQAALIEMFSQAGAKQGEALRKAVGDATLKALQGRELTLENIRKVLKTVTQAASTGVLQNASPSVDPEALLSKAIAGMDGALLQAVEANRRALQQFVDQGVGLQEERLRGALQDLEKLEDVFVSTVSKAAQAAGEQLQAPWGQVLESMQLKGTVSGAQAADAVEQLMTQAQTALRDSRLMGARAAQALMDSYAALVSGVLIGMSEGLQGGAAPSASRSRKK
jgi:primosomal protein N''